MINKIITKYIHENINIQTSDTLCINKLFKVHKSFKELRFNDREQESHAVINQKWSRVQYSYCEISYNSLEEMFGWLPCTCASGIFVWHRSQYDMLQTVLFVCCTLSQVC